MTIEIPESNKAPGLHYAFAGNGRELPIIDITDSTFLNALPDSRELEVLRRRYLEQTERSHRMPRWLWNLFMWQLRRKSQIYKAVDDAAGSFLPGLSTYLMKLPPAMLGAWANRYDRKVACSLPSVAVRLRLHHMATLASQAIAPLLKAKPDTPLHIINIAGGPCSDTFNTLRLLQKYQHGLLSGRRVRITVLDLDSTGPAFAKRALNAWLQPGAPLHGLDITLEHRLYDWNRIGMLKNLTTNPDLFNSTVLVSSEGGLFEYGTDSAISANLQTLLAQLPPATIIVGSVTRKGEVMQSFKSPPGGKQRSTIPRSLEEFGALAKTGGWKLVKAEENLLSWDVQLAR